MQHLDMMESLMPSTNGPFFYRRQKKVKIGLCALTFVPINNPSNNLSVIKNRSVCDDSV